MRHGIHFQAAEAHERLHLDPLANRLKHVAAGQPQVANVVVKASATPPAPGAWNVQLFHGLGDKGYTFNPIFLQHGRYPRARTAMNMAMRALRLPINFLRAPAHPGRRASRYQQLNAYGPRFADLLEDMLEDAVVSKFGHVALNDNPRLKYDPNGPVLWLPTWDNRQFMGGRNQSSLHAFAHEVALVHQHVPFRVRYHPLTLRDNQSPEARQELESAGVQAITASPYEALQGVRAVFTDTSSLGFEAYCMGIPVGLAAPHRAHYSGLHAELAERVPNLSAGKPDLLAWAEAPDRTLDTRWRSDLLYQPDPRRNDAFAKDLLSRI